jgi:hypothetical protein
MMTSTINNEAVKMAMELKKEEDPATTSSMVTFLITTKAEETALQKRKVPIYSKSMINFRILSGIRTRRATASNLKKIHHGKTVIGETSWLLMKTQSLKEQFCNLFSSTI